MFFNERNYGVFLCRGGRVAQIKSGPIATGHNSCSKGRCEDSESTGDSHSGWHKPNLAFVEFNRHSSNPWAVVILEGVRRKVQWCQAGNRLAYKDCMPILKENFGCFRSDKHVCSSFSIHRLLGSSRSSFVWSMPWGLLARQSMEIRCTLPIARAWWARAADFTRGPFCHKPPGHFPNANESRLQTGCLISVRAW